MVKSKDQIEQIIDKLLDITGVRSARQLSLSFFGSQNVVANWKAQESISSEGIDTILQYCDTEGINLNWLFLNRGGRYLADLEDLREGADQYNATGDLRDVFYYMEFAVEIYRDYRGRYEAGEIDEEEYHKHMRILKRQIHIRTFKAAPE